MKPILLAVSLFAFASPALAQSSVNERHTLASGGRVELDNLAGEIRVRAATGNEVTLTGTLGEGQRLEVEKSADRLELRVVYPQRSGHSEGARLELRVPRGALLETEAVSARVDIAEVDLERLEAQTVSGSLSVSGRAKEAQLSTVSGSLETRLATQRLRANTVSGRLSIGEGAAGDLGLESISGGLSLKAGALSRLHAETVSGSQDIAVGALAAGGNIGLETVSGSISLRLPVDVSARLRVETFSGDIESDAGQVQRPEYGPGRNLETRLGAGNGDVTVDSHSGSVRVRRGG